MSTIAESLKRGREALVGKLLVQGGLNAGFPRALSVLVDGYFRRAMAGRGPGAALVAVGGYGRSELCPGSDVDVLLVGRGQAAELAGEFFRPLWDAGFDLGHGVRTVRECLDLAATDHQVLASLLDARLVAGEAGIFQELDAGLDREVLPEAGPGFAAWLHRANAERERAWGRGEALMEPDLKNGPGGLRDWHQMLWLARVLGRARGLAGPVGPFSGPDLDKLRGCMALVLRARMGLHVAAGRKRDKLFLDLQPRVAELMGYAGPDLGRDVETFLSRLNAAMSRLVLAREAMFRETAGLPPLELPGKMDHPCVRATTRGLEPEDFTGGCPRACALMELFRAMADTGLPLSWAGRAEVERARAEFGRDLAGLSGAHLGLAKVLMADRSGLAGRGMLTTGFLDALVPEFGRARDLVQFDAYHLHPVGMHSLKTARRLAAFFRDPGERANEIAAGLDRPEVLILAGLLHDVGKGGEGDHAKAGAAIARAALERFGADKGVRDEVAFLVEHHLLLPEAAARTRLSDLTAVSQVASRVGSARMLDMLYLLSTADAEATGPRADSQWNRALLSELYFKLKWLFERGPLGRPHAVQRILAARDKVRALATGMYGLEFVERRLGNMPPDYVQSRDPKDIVRDLGLIRRMEEAVEVDQARKPKGRGGVGVCELEGRMLERAGCFELAFAVPDRPGLFATLAGVLALFGMNIHSAELYTFSDKSALDFFIVDAPADLLYLDDLYARLKASTASALAGRLDLDYRIGEKRSSLLAACAGTGRGEPRVAVDNQAGEFFTLIEVVSPDRLGLLYDIARALRGLDLDVGLATISTRGDMVRDVFHVRDFLGSKADDPALVAEIRRTLLRAVCPV